MPLLDTRITEGIIGGMVLLIICFLIRRHKKPSQIFTTLICIVLLSGLLATVFVPLTGW